MSYSQNFYDWYVRNQRVAYVHYKSKAISFIKSESKPRWLVKLDLNPPGSFCCSLPAGYSSIKSHFHVAHPATVQAMMFCHDWTQLLQSLLWMTGGCINWKGASWLSCERFLTRFKPGWISIFWLTNPSH